MAYEFDKMSINGTTIDAKDKTARDKLTAMEPVLASTQETASNALNMANAHDITITDNTNALRILAENVTAINGNMTTLTGSVQTLSGNVNSLTDRVASIESKEYQELLYTLQEAFTLQSYGWITCIRCGNLAVVSFYGLAADETSTAVQGIIRLANYKARQPAAAVMFDNTDGTHVPMRITADGTLLMAVRTTANHDYTGEIIFPITEV